MPGWAKMAAGAIAVLIVGLVLIMLFNPLAVIDARYGRGRDVTAIAEHITAGRCDRVQLPRSGSEAQWTAVCQSLSHLIDDDRGLSIVDRSRSTRDDPLGLVNTTSYRYTFGVYDRTGANRTLDITVNEDNALLGAGVDQVTIAPDESLGYDNQHRYEPNYGFTERDASASATSTQLSAAQPLNEAVVAALSGGGCAEFRAERGSTYLAETVTEEQFVDFCQRVGPLLSDAELDYGEVRIMRPAGGGAEIAATDVTVTSVGAPILRLLIGHDLENGEWRLRSIFATEDPVRYTDNG